MDKDDDGNTRRLPSGLVTFVFTDIEASTRLYKTLGDDVAGDVFDLHNALLRAAWDAHDGHEIHTEGDSFFVVFEDPNQAVNACLDAQQRLANAPWPDAGDVRVRIGIHCGLAAPRNDDYMALAVHQAARVMSAANGNQILVTNAVIERLTTDDRYSLTRAGTYRVRDFDQSPTLYRIDSASGLGPANDQPPRAIPAQHHNLVPRLTSFVGRQADIVAVNAMIEPARAVTIVGLGGMGKTRLATEVGLEVAPTWQGGVWMVELAEVLDPALIAEEVAIAVGVASAGISDRWTDVTEFIGDTAMLLILDNVEHLVDEVARLVPDLLRSCPNCAVVNTSREPLNCPGEIVYRLQPLELALDADDPTAQPSVELFIDRARAVAMDQQWTAEALEHVLEICSRVDGLPLAIEIAAAQAGVLQLAEIRAGLDNRFRLLRSRDRALPERQRTMDGLLGWSYQLLDETEQRAFRRLSVFAGSFSIDAAEAALAGDGIDGDDVPELTWSLVDKSLIAADLSNSSTRYRLFESVQQYAMRLLIKDDDPVRSAVALAHWLLERVAPWQVNDRVWLGDVAIELANIRKVVDVIAATEPEMAQQLMCSVGRYHDTMQSYQVGIDELTRAAQVLPEPTRSRVALLAETAHLHLRMGHTSAASVLLDEAGDLRSTVGPTDWNDVAIERVRGELAIRANDFATAIEVARAALGEPISNQGRARMWSLAGIAESSRGNLEEGLVGLETALSIYEELGDAAALALAHANVAEAAWRSNLFERAAKHQRFCLEDALAIGQRLAVATSLIMAGYLAEHRGDWQTAICLLAHADAMQREAGHQPYEEAVLAVEQAHQRAVVAIGAHLVSDSSLRGRHMSVLDAVDLAFATFAHEASPLTSFSDQSTS